MIRTDAHSLLHVYWMHAQHLKMACVIALPTISQPFHAAKSKRQKQQRQYFLISSKRQQFNSGRV